MVINNRCRYAYFHKQDAFVCNSRTSIPKTDTSNINVIGLAAFIHTHEQKNTKSSKFTRFEAVDFHVAWLTDPQAAIAVYAQHPACETTASLRATSCFLATIPVGQTVDRARISLKKYFDPKTLLERSGAHNEPSSTWTMLIPSLRTWSTGLFNKLFETYCLQTTKDQLWVQMNGPARTRIGWFYYTRPVDIHGWHTFALRHWMHVVSVRHFILQITTLSIKDNGNNIPKDNKREILQPGSLSPSWD